MTSSHIGKRNDKLFFVFNIFPNRIFMFGKNSPIKNGKPAIIERGQKNDNISKKWKGTGISFFSKNTKKGIIAFNIP